MTANNFGVAVKSVIHEVCLAICQNPEPQYIRLPKARGEMREKVSDSETKFGMIQAFEYVDDTHIPMKFPQFTGLVLLQAVLFTTCTGCVQL